MRWKTSWQPSGRASELRARYEAFLEEHQADYRKLYDRVDVDLGEDLSAGLPTSRRLAYGAEGVDDPSLYGLYLQYSRYLIIAGSRPDSQALKLQGIWNDTVMPPWSSNYTNDINVEMNYWPAETGNLSECHLPLTDLLKELSVTGRQTIEGYYHMKGWVTHHNTDLWRSSEPSCEDASWSWWPMGGAWMCEHIRSVIRKPLSEISGRKDPVFLWSTAISIWQEAMMTMPPSLAIRSRAGAGSWTEVSTSFRPTGRGSFPFTGPAGFQASDGHLHNP